MIKLYLLPKDVKHINMRLKDGAVFVSYPYYLREEAVQKIVAQKWSQFEKAYRNYEASYRFISDKIYLFGKSYRFVYQSSSLRKVEVKDDLIIVSCLHKEDIARVYALHFRNELSAYVQDFYEEYRKVLRDYGLDRKIEFKYRLLKSAWGVCRPRKDEITINLSLVHYPLCALKSVVYHELTHLIIPNHSKRFYEILLRHMPDYQKAHELLKRSN